VDVKYFLDVERLAGAGLHVAFDELPVGAEVRRVEALSLCLRCHEYAVSAVDVRPEKQRRHVDIRLAPVVDKVGIYEIHRRVTKCLLDLFHEQGCVVVVFSGHAHQRFVALFQSGISWRVSEVVVAFGKYGEADARFIGEHGDNGFDDAVFRAVCHHVGGPVGGSLRAQ